MNEIKITGGIPLKGQVRIQGSKNAALPIMAAALLNKGTTILQGCPKIADVFLMEEIMRGMVVRTCWEGDALILQAEDLSCPKVDRSLGERMRSSVVLLGSLLGREGQAQVPYPGGCVIGARPIDLHLLALEKLGAVFWEEDGMLFARAGRLLGGEICFSKSSVGATQNALLGAVLAEGETVLRGCSREPEVVWLCRFLNQAGARILGAGTSCLRVLGVRELRDTKFQIPGDRIVAGTYVCASAITRGEGVLIRPPIEEMGALLSAYKKIGGQYAYAGGKLSLYSHQASGPVGRLETQAYPGFPTDLQSVFLAVLAGGEGESLLTETIFEDRFKTVPQLLKMGADITVQGNSARVVGRRLFGAPVTAQELRGGAALVVAGLGAWGETRVGNRNFIERGYEDICRDLQCLGAQAVKD